MASQSGVAHSNYSGKTPRLANFSVHGVLGDELRKARLKAGLTQEDLAFKARISRNYVSLLELDQKSPTVALLLRICRAMKEKPSCLIPRLKTIDDLLMPWRHSAEKAGG